MFDQLNEGQNVEFDREADPRDPKRSRAVNVRIVG
jgi:cold shock CspA family protein